MSVHWLTSCFGKLRYESWDAAHRVIGERQRKAKRAFTPHKQAKTSMAALTAYHCRHCQGWHIGNEQR